MFTIVIREDGEKVGTVEYSGRVAVQSEKDEVLQILWSIFGDREDMLPSEFIHRAHSLHRFKPSITWELVLENAYVE